MVVLLPGDTVGWQMGHPEGDRNRKRRALSFAAGRINAPPVATHKFLDESEADTATLVCSTPRVGHAMKPLEDAREVIGRNADAGIADLDGRSVAVVADAHRD